MTITPDIGTGYGAWEGDPVRYTTTESWIYADGKWKEWNATGEVLANAHMLTQEAFEKQFPDLPPLPPDAFAAKP